MVWLAVVVAACGGGGSDGAAAPPGTLRVGLERPKTLDPALAQFPAELVIVEQLFDSLTAYDPDTLVPVPSVAQRWESNPELTVWDFYLSPEARFSTGRAITAADVKFTFERIAAPGSGSRAGPELAVVAGYEEFQRGDVGELAGLVVVDEATVRFTLTQPRATFAAVVGQPAFGIVPPEAVAAPEPEFGFQPVGSGPFALRSRSADVIRLVPAPGRDVEIRGIDVFLSDNAQAPYGAFLRGRLDWASVPAERVAEVVAGRGDGEFRPYPAQLYYGFNLANPKYSDARFREAIVAAIDRKRLVDTVYGDRVRPTSSLVPEGFPGHVSDACGQPCDYDPVRSRRLLSEVFGDGAVHEVVLDYDDDPVQDALVRAMQADLAAVGIPSVLRPHSFADYLQFVVTGAHEVFRLAWIAPTPTADSVIGPLFLTGSADNVTKFSSPEVDTLVGQARSTADPGPRDDLYRQAETLILGQFAVIPIAQLETHTVTSERVRGLRMNAFGTFDGATVTLDGEG